jgi:hypothetical protein
MTGWSCSMSMTRSSRSTGTPSRVGGSATRGCGGLNALLTTLSAGAAPVIVAQRLRKGSCGSPRGAVRLITDALAQTGRLLAGGAGQGARRVLLRADSAFYGGDIVAAARAGGAQVSITVRLDSSVTKTIAMIAPDAWTTIDYPEAIRDEDSGQWISRAEVAEIPYTAFTSRIKAKHVTGRLVVRRIPDLNTRTACGQDTLFDTWRFHAFFTTTSAEDLDTVAADKTHRGHAIIEQVNTDLKGSALAHLPDVIWS